MKTFADPSTSPARYVRTLTIDGPDLITITSPDADPWLRSFHLIERLVIDTARRRDVKFSFFQLRGSFPILKSLDITCAYIPPSEVFGLICSFPLLKVLYLDSEVPMRETDGWDAPPTLPKLTRLRLHGHVPSVARGLLGLPGRLHFCWLMVTCNVAEDFESVADLASRGSGTLESLRVYCDRSRAFSSFPAPTHTSPSCESRWISHANST